MRLTDKELYNYLDFIREELNLPDLFINYIEETNQYRLAFGVKTGDFKFFNDLDIFRSRNEFSHFIMGLVFGLNHLKNAMNLRADSGKKERLTIFRFVSESLKESYEKVKKKSNKNQSIADMMIDNYMSGGLD